MTKPRICILLMALIVAVPSLAVSSPSDVTPDQYRAELDHLLAATKQLDQPGAAIPELINSLPTAWRVSTERGIFEVSTEWLREHLGELENEYDQDVVDKIRDRLTHDRADLDEYEKGPGDVSRQRAIVAGILSRPEFQDLHGPTWVDRLKQWFIQFLIRMVGRAITSSIVPNIGKFFVYGLMVVAFLALTYWVYRSIRTTAKVETILPEPLPVSAREWRVWLADAREAARLGNWQDAIHLAYWAGISFLESQGVWRPDVARTPREYLRLMPTANEHHPVLAALTNKFEKVWYAGQPADSQAFSQTLEELEKLGCR
jgi:hypothetical protein